MNGIGLLNTLSSLGYSGSSPEEMLRKALTTDQYTGQDPFVDPNASIGAFQIEDLQPLLTMQTAQLRELKLWSKLYKNAKKNLVWQYNNETSVGSERNSNFVGEGAVGQQEVSAWERVLRYIKFVAEWGLVSLPSQMVALGGITPAEREMASKTIMSKHVNDRIRHLLFQNERQMFFADASILGANSYNGIIQQIIVKATTDALTADQIIDLHGGPLTRTAIELGTQKAVDNHLIVGDNVILMGPTGVFSSYASTLDSKERYQIALSGEGDRRILTGTPVAGHVTQYGPVKFEHDIFMSRTQVRGGVPATDRGSPATTLTDPASVTPANIGANANSAFYSDDAGTWYYTVTSLDLGGEDAVGTQSAGVTVAAGEAVTVTIADPGSGPTPNGYRIYRGRLSDFSDQKFVKDIARTGASTVYTDTNYWMPGCDIAVQLDMSPESLEYAQMGPLMRFNLPFFGLGNAFAIVLFGDLAVKNARKFVVYRNIGTQSDQYLESLQAA